jgi:pimeloyl-ACP methyl ester carboxylesterase
MSATQPTLAGFQSETTVVGGLRLHSWTGGDPNAPPVLLWHGFLGTGYTWHKVTPKLVAAGLCVLVPDMRWYGDSDKPPGTVRQVVENVEAVTLFDCGHFVPEERPDKVVQAVLKHGCRNEPLNEEDGT